jgi:hypothetical protein
VRWYALVQAVEWNRRDLLRCCHVLLFTHSVFVDRVGLLAPVYFHIWWVRCCRGISRHRSQQL